MKPSANFPDGLAYYVKSCIAYDRDPSDPDAINYSIFEVSAPTVTES